MLSYKKIICGEIRCCFLSTLSFRWLAEVNQLKSSQSSCSLTYSTISESLLAALIQHSFGSLLSRSASEVGQSDHLLPTIDIMSGLQGRLPQLSSIAKRNFHLIITRWQWRVLAVFLRWARSQKFWFTFFRCKCRSFISGRVTHARKCT